VHRTATHCQYTLQRCNTLQRSAYSLAAMITQPKPAYAFNQTPIVLIFSTADMFAGIHGTDQLQ